MLPDQADLIQNSWSGWNNLDVYDGADTGMAILEPGGRVTYEAKVEVFAT